MMGLAEKYTYRQVTRKLDLLVQHFPVVVVTGARQVGKTTLLQHVYGRAADYVALDPTDVVVPWNLALTT